MSINRYNYEEFFLLYADGELGPLETERVNQFVQFHPDLKEELDLLMDCKLVADLPVFFPKEKLYKQTIWDTENINQTQSQLLLLLDNELTGKDKEILVKNIGENAVLQEEWNTLQQAKLPVETIAHPYKKPLYKERSIPRLGWLRWAAAAAILGAGWFLAGKNMGGNHGPELNMTAKNTAIKQPQPIAVPEPNTARVDAAPNQEEDNGANAAQNNPAETINENNSATAAKPDNQHVQNAVAVTVNKEDPAEENADDHMQSMVAANDPVADEYDSRSPLITNRTTDNAEDIGTDYKPGIARVKTAPKPGQLASAITTKPSQSLADLQNDADNDEYVRIAGARVKKQKIRGVFRNVFRGIGRTFSNSKVEAAPVMALNN